MQDIHDPFSYVLSEIRAHDAGQRGWRPGIREHYLRVLTADEAQELAWGRRHLTVVHGEVLDEAQAEALDDVVCAILDLLDGRWHRFGGIPDHHFTLTVDGPDADDLISRVETVAACTRPGHWTVVPSAFIDPAS